MQAIRRTKFPLGTPCLSRALHQHRLMGTVSQSKEEGDISSVFVSLSGRAPPPLPQRFAEVKKELATGHEERLIASWTALLKDIKKESRVISTTGPAIIPSINFTDLDSDLTDFYKNLRKRGVAVVRGVVPKEEARAYKEETEQYVKANPSTKAFPNDNPCVFELYWSPAQIKARAHPNLLKAQRVLMNAWHSKDRNALISTSTPVSYADRLRIRQPGDSGFALGPHTDGGSVERWEKNGYGINDVYKHIFNGKWKNYDPFEASCRLPAVTDLYQGAGACSMFRMFQGWLSMSKTGPGEGTLQVNPMLKLTTAYTLLRPFFRAIQPLPFKPSGRSAKRYRETENWAFEPNYTPELQGAALGNSQEFNDILHPHLQLAKSMVHIPDIEPGDYVVWHCDSIHAVDKIHKGTSDSSVMYIPACPLTENNARYLSRQRDAFLQGTPGPDFPGGKGESDHVGRPTLDTLKSIADTTGLKAMGFARFEETAESSAGEKAVFAKANEILGL